MRYLVQVEPDKLSAVTQSLSVIGIKSIVMFDYLAIDIPLELVPKIRAIPGVIDVVPDKKYGIAYIPTAIDKKLAEFQRLFWSNPITGPPSALAYAVRVDTGKKRVPTSESRKMIGADIAEAEGITGKNIRVAVLDTGTSYDFLFQGPYHEGSKSSIEGQPVPLDEVGHGVHVQTTISGRPFQSIHGLLKGIAPDAQVAAFKCLGGGVGVGMTSWILRAIADAVEWNCNIINMSLGGDDEDYTTSPYHKIISGLTNQGIIFCIAAGNSGPESNTIGSPGSMPDALTVGAVSYPDGEIAKFSSRGPTLNNLIKPDVCAPGVDILSTAAGYIAAMQFLDGPPSLAAISGTSMATPAVSGWAALVKELYRKHGVELTTPMIKDMMERYGRPKDNTYGWGVPTWDIAKRYLAEVLGYG